MRGMVAPKTCRPRATQRTTMNWRDKIGLWWIRVRRPWWWIREHLKTSAQLQKTNADLRQKLTNTTSEQADALFALGEEEGHQRLIAMKASAGIKYGNLFN